MSDYYQGLSAGFKGAAQSAVDTGLSALVRTYGSAAVRQMLSDPQSDGDRRAMDGLVLDVTMAMANVAISTGAIMDTDTDVLRGITRTCVKQSPVLVPQT